MVFRLIRLRDPPPPIPATLFEIEKKMIGTISMPRAFMNMVPIQSIRFAAPGANKPKSIPATMQTIIWTYKGMDFIRGRVGIICSY